MAATPKPVRKQLKKMGTEARERPSSKNKAVSKGIKESLVKQAKKEGVRKRKTSFIRSQY